ncbi:MAG: hypothetical protein H6R25_3709 [Proteobacteria bacterium]|nr:hypothetical protein [Pseudomonadota bacterium]
MSDLAIMFFKPEFHQQDRERLSPLFADFMNKWGIEVIDNIQVVGEDNKSKLFNRVYASLIKNSNLDESDGFVGSFKYLKRYKSFQAEHLFNEWIKPENIPKRLCEDKYYIQLDGINVINPFCPWQKKLFVESSESVELFLIKKRTSIPWSLLKERFQGPAIPSPSNSDTLRTHLSQCRWYTPTTNGLHLSGSDADAERETNCVKDFFSNVGC